MRRDSPRPQPVPALIRGAVAQQQVRTGVAQQAAEDAGGLAPPEYADDAEAAAGGIPVNGVYRQNGLYIIRTV